MVDNPASPGDGSQSVNAASSSSNHGQGRPDGATIDAAPPFSGAGNGGIFNTSSSSGHPYASLLNGQAIPLPDRSSSTSDEEDGTLTSLASATTATSSTPQTPHRPLPQHPFDTHAFVLHMEKSDFSPGVSRTLMETTKQLVNDRSEEARRNLLHKEDVENAAYLFKAALSELRTELSVRARNDGLTLRSTTSLIRREVDSLSQKLKEDIGTLKHDIEMDMNNRKSETRSDQKTFDISIEEINNKFTISLGDLRTEIEQAKWDATRRAIAIIAGVVFVVISVTTLTDANKNPPLPPPPTTTPSRVTMRDIGVGDSRLGDEDDALLDLRLKGLGGLGDEFVRNGHGSGKMVDTGGGPGGRLRI